MANKNVERFFVEDAAGRLGVAWEIIDREGPDFEIHCAGEVFGLEVTEVFVDERGAFGSPAKRAEIENQRRLDGLKGRYYELGGLPVAADFLAMPSPGDSFLEKMRAAAPRVPGEVVPFKDKDGVKVFMSFASLECDAWQFVLDKVGYVKGARAADLQPAIDEKGEKLGSYKEVFANVDLLIVAHRLTNAGRLAAPPAGLVIENQGFRAIYFLSYPESCVRVG
jgi:hypothetical protein